MGCSLVIILVAFLLAGYCVSVARGSKAKILLESVDHDNNTIYKLNEDILEKISELQGPIRVVAAVGNARVGKSTTLNLISHIWIGKDETSAVEEIFKTGHSHEAVTRNVWAHIIKPKNETGGNIVLLDVEGTDLGDDRVTDRLSTFTAMMSSELNVFAKTIVGNSDIGFLYRIARFSNLVFKDEGVQKNFPKLRIILRSELDRPSDEEIRNGIFKRGRENAQIIEKYFPRRTIEVAHIPTVNGNRPLEDQKKLSESERGAFQSLAKDLQNSPEKRSFAGSPIDGTSFKQLAKDVVEAMNSDNSWKDFGDVYATLERDICRRTYEKHIRPVVKQSSKAMGDKMIDALDKFKDECFLGDEITKTKEELRVTLNEKRGQEEENRRREEEEGRRREEEKRKRKEEEENKWEPYWTYAKHFGSFVLGAFTVSDKDLKSNITTLPHSEYNDIGLRGVCWNWNESAKKSFGLTGAGCGVIAQEVRMLYPWAVLQRKDGYLRVHYDMLREMIYIVRNKRLPLKFYVETIYRPSFSLVFLVIS